MKSGMNGIAGMVIAAVIESMQRTPLTLRTIGYKLSSNIKGYIPTKPSGRIRRSNSKYIPNQGKQERARRLRVGSAAWHSKMMMAS